MRNLLSNAIKYTNVNGCIEINAALYTDTDFIVFSVKDNGIGIPKESQEKMFKKFFRASNATDLYAHGSGIGLYVTKRIIEEHNGSITFEPGDDGVGTIFRVTLPYPPKKG